VIVRRSSRETMSAKNGKTRSRSRRPARKPRKESRVSAFFHGPLNYGGDNGALREDAPLYQVSSHVAPIRQFSTIDLFCGAGGITEGFCHAGFVCLYANDINRWAIETFRANHPTTHADNRPIEQVDAAALRRELGVERGELDVVVGGPPCQGFSINAPERFLDDPRNSLFKHYVRFLEEFEPKTLLVKKFDSFQQP